MARAEKGTGSEGEIETAGGPSPIVLVRSIPVSPISRDRVFRHGVWMRAKTFLRIHHLEKESKQIFWGSLLDIRFFNKKKAGGPKTSGFFYKPYLLLQPGNAFGWPNVNRLFHLLPDGFLPGLVEP